MDPLPYDNHKTIGEELLTPTKIYMNILDVIKKYNFNINGLAHITGGGLLKLKRITKYGFDINNPIEIPKIFQWIQEIGNIEFEEMYRTFNMGVGFIIVVSHKSNKHVIDDILQMTNGKVIGKVIEDEKIVIKNVLIE